jgi:hypothetical protein
MTYRCEFTFPPVTSPLCNMFNSGMYVYLRSFIGDKKKYFVIYFSGLQLPPDCDDVCRLYKMCRNQRKLQVFHTRAEHRFKCLYSLLFT